MPGWMTDDLLEVYLVCLDYIELLHKSLAPPASGGGGANEVYPVRLSAFHKQAGVSIGWFVASFDLRLTDSDNRITAIDALTMPTLIDLSAPR
ncbi:hypothetical protein THAOC_26901, partial [Thalassiosira oceanica]